LTVTDRQGPIGVGEVTGGRRYKGLTTHLAHRRQDVLIANASGQDLLCHHMPALAREIVHVSLDGSLVAAGFLGMVALPLPCGRSRRFRTMAAQHA
jgi:hypothetical protein